MALRIFDNDPDAAPKRFDSDDLVGRFRSGYQAQGNPAALEEWRITTGDPDVADAVTALFGSDEGPQEWETKTEEKIEVFTNAGSVEIILDSPSAVKTGMVLWGRKGKLRECDGLTQKDGTECVCPQTVRERKEAADQGTGCDPSIMLFFRLADSPDLGKFRFMSGSWSMAGEIGEAEEALAAVEGPALATLTLEKVSYETKAGQKREFTKPVLKVIGPAPSDEYGDEEPF